MKKIFTTILLLALCIFTFGCGNNGGDGTGEGTGEGNDDSVIKGLYGINLPKEINNSIELPDTNADKTVEIVWESSKPDVISNEGYFLMPNDSTEVVLTATYISGSKQETFDYKITAIVDRKDKFTVAYNMYEGTIRNSYTSNGNFKYSKYSTFDVVFESMDQNIINNKGEINQKDVDQETYIKLSITNTATNETRIYYKKVKVMRYSDKGFLEIISNWTKEKLDAHLRGEVEYLPTEHEKYPSTITWLGGTKILMTNDGKFVRPVEYVDDIIKVKITYNDLSATYEFKVNNVGGNTEEGFLNDYLSSIMPTEITAHHNYLYQQYGPDNDYFLHHQVKVNAGGVLNLLSGSVLTINKNYYIDTDNYTGTAKAWGGKHPALDADLGTTIVGKSGTSSLDAFYNHFRRYYGWEMNASIEEKQAAYDSFRNNLPNDDNIIWIVVHESGMPAAGSDAELLAKIQKDQADGNRAYREASWNYQVDEGQIYQSFSDYVYTWHAGGDYGKHLPFKNSNSIGIEMCINRDGNYDGSMRHDAKLVANLMYNHNLGFENVIRHYDTAGKECPSYMLRTDRYNEFLSYVAQEYYAILHLRDAEVNWTVSNLDTLFTKGGNGLYYAKPVTEPTPVTITLEVTKGSYHFEKTITITLQPDTVDTSIWEWK